MPRVAKSYGRGAHRGEWQASVSVALDREVAKKYCWGVSKNRNGMMWFPKGGGGFGTMFWHVNGRVRLFLHKGYVTEGHARQLFCDGFGPLIHDDKVLIVCLDTLHHVRGALTVNTGKRLPYVKVDDFKKSHGISITLGDRSHPDSVEVEYGVPNCLKPFEKLLNEYYDLCVLNVWESRNKGMKWFYVV